MEERWEACRTKTIFLVLRKDSQHWIRVRMMTGKSFIETPVKCIRKVWAVSTVKGITLNPYPS